MRSIWTMPILLALVVVLCAADRAHSQTKPAKTVVEEFWKMDTQGGMLTDQGWRAAASFFLRPIDPPGVKTICIIDHPYSVSEARMTDSTAEVIVNTVGRVRKINPDMRLDICSDQGKDFWLNKLILTSKHWEPSPDHQSLREVDGVPEWRLDQENATVYLSRQTAIQYLRDIRDQSNDANAKRNAEQSLAILRGRH